jgi:hypothetical protein
MIKIIQNFYKLSENKSYKCGDIAEFDDKTEERLIKEGLARKVIEKKVVKKSKK